MRKLLLVASLLTLGGVAHADQIASNLASFTTADACGTPSGLVYIDGIKDEPLSEKLAQTLKDQDTLYDSKFNSLGTGCKFFMGLNMNAISVKNGAGASIGYAYSYGFSLFLIALEGDVGGVERKFFVPGIYDIKGIGVVGSRPLFEGEVAATGADIFRQFLLDWRKTH